MGTGTGSLLGAVLHLRPSQGFWCPAGLCRVEAGGCSGRCFLQTHQTIVVQLLQSTMRLLECPWLQQQHKGSVEACIRTLAMVGECPPVPQAPAHSSHVPKRTHPLLPGASQ